MKPASGETVAVEALTRGVGVLVRQGRTRHGLTRRALAAATGISERYLAQLEGGSANVSLNLLARIGAALGVSIHALIPAEAAAGGAREEGDLRSSACAGPARPRWANGSANERALPSCA